MARKTEPKIIIYLRSATQAALVERSGEYYQAVRFWTIAKEWAERKNVAYVENRIEFCKRMVERPF